MIWTQILSELSGIGIHLNPGHLDSQECQVQNSRKPPAFIEDSIEEVVPTPTLCPSGQVEMVQVNLPVECEQESEFKPGQIKIVHSWKDFKSSHSISVIFCEISRLFCTKQLKEYT